MTFSITDLIDPALTKLVVELGTGDGATASRIMSALPPDSRLVTVNWPNPPSGDNPWRYLAAWAGDPRLTALSGDTRDPELARLVPDNIDLLYIDSTHTRECASGEWGLYEPKLRDRATVVVDDLNQNDMAEFWDGLRGDKTTVHDGRVGILRYERC